MNLLYLLVLVAGFFILIKSADFVIESSSVIAKRAGISTLVIGLTLVAFGTSLPEFAVSLISSISAYVQGTNADIAIGNVIGSNFANLTLILGVAAFLTPLTIPKNIIKNDMPYLLMVSVVFVILLSQFGSSPMMYRLEGLILLIFFGYYLYILSREKKVTHDIETHPMSVSKSWILLLLGFLGVALGGYLVTYFAERLSISLLVDLLNMNPEKVTAFVGLTVVAFGTSLPELVTTIVAIRKKEQAIAIGNVVGSNIFNILLVAGSSSLIIPLGVTSEFIIDAILVVFVTFIIYVFIYYIKKPHKLFGWMLLNFYISYLIYIIIRTL
ncbi:MAG: calcium/sodium antiporter [Acholeplasmataceae bacterium]